MPNPRRTFRVLNFLLTLLLAAAIGFLALVLLYASVKLLHGGPFTLKDWLVHIQIEGTSFTSPQGNARHWSWWRAVQPELVIAGMAFSIGLARYAVRRKMKSLP